jgi:putative transposase
MAKRQFQLSESEIQHFRQAEQQTRDVHELKRLQAVQLYGSGVRLSEILKVVTCGESSVRQWAQHYRQNGMEALRSHWQGANANKLTPEQRADLRERLQTYRPVDVHLSQGQFWTVSDLRVAVQHWYGVTYQSEDSYLHLLRRCGFSYQRAERVYRSRPNVQTVNDFEAALEKK